MAAQLTLTKGPFDEGAFGVEMRGQQFFSGAGFAGEQDAGVAAGGHGGLVEHSFEGGAGADHARRAGDFAEAAIFFAELGLIERVFQRQAELCRG